MTAIAHAYWRSIQRGTRSLEQVPEHLRGEVQVLADQDLTAGVILQADYDRWMEGDAP